MTEAEYKQAFINKHGDFKVITSPMETDGTYRKNYMFEDGAEIYEVNRQISDSAVAVSHGIKIPVEVTLIETELWSSDDATSVKFHYAC